MRANEFINEAAIGTNPKRKVREGGRTARGHEPVTPFKNAKDCAVDESGKAPKKLCISKKSDDELGASQLSSCKAQGLRKRDTKRKFRIGKSTQKINGKKVKGKKYGGPLPDWSAE
jgi:hypothetical protein